MLNTGTSIDNTQARHLWLHLQDMLTPPMGPGSAHRSLNTVCKLGMVQLDSINAVVRAHHHILWSRHTAYREENYNEMLGCSPQVFEHFSHDAASKGRLQRLHSELRRLARFAGLSQVSDIPAPSPHP